MSNPAEWQFNLDQMKRPRDVAIPELWYPDIQSTWNGCTTPREYDPIDGVRVVVIHATAGSSSEGAVSVMRAGKASFHWLVPDENEPQHGSIVWACAPEARAAWHVRNSRSHPDIWGGENRINHFSLGIEVVNQQNPTDEFSDWQVEVTALIVRYCWAKYPNLKHVVSHAKLDPERRTDPGVKFPWNDFRKLVLESEESDNPLLMAATSATAINESFGEICGEHV